jgi:SWI/SNF-related matrix-associated actin-dependent regulator of chromatin subfamily A-like protein 1
VADLLEDGRRVVLFCEFSATHQELCRQLRKKFPDDVMSGDASLASHQRTQLVAEANAIAKVLVLTFAYCEGVTLTQFDTVLIVDRHWVPDKEKQAEDRVHRIGQTRTAYVEYLHANGTTDDLMSEVHWTKEGRSSQSVGSAQLRIYEWLNQELEQTT